MVEIRVGGDIKQKVPWRGYAELNSLERYRSQGYPEGYAYGRRLGGSWDTGYG